jgi:Uma2 family endonuclease
MIHAAAVQVRPVTADEFLQIPDDGLRRELVEGEVRVMSPAGHLHGDVAMQIGWRLASHVATHALGKVYAAETAFRIASNPDTLLAPDASFVTLERAKVVEGTEGPFPGPPDLAVEVVSPRDSFTDVEDKVARWLDAGCDIVVVINPRNRFTWVYRSGSEPIRLSESDVLDVSDVVPGWKLPLREVFA